MNGNLAFVLFLSAFEAWGWDIEQLGNYSATCLIILAAGFLVVLYLNLQLNQRQAMHDADPRNKIVPWCPMLGQTKRVCAIYAENVTWIMSLSLTYFLFLAAYEGDSIDDIHALDEWGSTHSNMLILVSMSPVPTA